MINSQKFTQKAMKVSKKINEASTVKERKNKKIFNQIEKFYPEWIPDRKM